ncbi:uncharacterized protein TRIADDRAFT_53319 [Trichoplax adhaerens]|uniref:Ig-like domain-containing protein n=1 Tax=Trichoplax adhaerens TaxID=10228 RepID=B3RNW8_TRIAD|nr:predicted protein [Trichoplax adhaerens]EDV28087.1 predicted protein [Trichoplax adhaerens]|eukprot:XP_002109921.1 predicted protein [Trichoplax adhaerens]
MGNDTDLSTTIKCTAKGIPRPSVQWAKCHHGQCRSHLFPSQNIQIINETTVVATLKIDRNNPNQIGNISCRSVNLCQSLLSRKIWNVQRPSVSTLDNVCKLLLPAQPHQLAYFGLPYDITFTMQYQGCQCGVDCTYQASFYFKRKNIIINDGTNTKISSNFACPNSSWPCSNSSSKPYLGCCQRNITLRIQNVTVDDLGEYQFEYYGVHCQCIQGMKASINLQAQECINSGIILSARKDKEKDSSVTFSCFARGNPRPQIQWTKCNQTQCLPYPFRFQRTKVINDTTTVSTLTIYRTEGEDLGNISCQSVNPCKTVPGHQSWTVKSSSTIKIILIITFGSSTGLVSIVVLIVVFIPDRRTKLSYFTKVMMATKIKTDKEKILIIRHCYTQPAVDLTTTIVSQLKRYFDGQIMTMFNNAPYDIHPTIYLKFIRHFRMVVLLHEDQVEEGNEMKCQHFIPCVKSIIDDCISTGGIPILPILINDPRNYPDNLDQMECLTWDEKWNDDDQENFKQELHDTIYNCYHGLCPSYLHTSISNLSDTNDDNDDETTVLMHSGYEN